MASDTLAERLEAHRLPADEVIDVVWGWLRDLAVTPCESCHAGRCVNGSHHLAYLYTSQILAEREARADIPAREGVTV
jgi:hypothetical protein